MGKSYKTREAERLQLLKEAKRIFIDANKYPTEFVLVGYCRLVKELFKYQLLPDNSITIAGLENVFLDLETDFLFKHFFERMTYKEISDSLSNNISAKAVQLDVKKDIETLRKNALRFFLPKRKEFLNQYSLFLNSIISDCPSDKDIYIYDLGFNMHIANALFRSRIYTTSQLFFYSKEDLLKIPHLGPVYVDEIISVMNNLLTGEIQ